MHNSELFFKNGEGLAAAELGHKFLDAGGTSRSRKNGVHGDTGARAVFGKAASDCELGGLGGAVVDHLDGNLYGAFAADENDAAPVALLHAGNVRAAETHAAEDVDFEKSPPILVRNLLERLGLENSEVVDENVHQWKTLEKSLSGFGCGKVAGKAFDFGSGRGALNLLGRLGDAFLGTAINDDARAFGGELAGDGEADALG